MQKMERLATYVARIHCSRMGTGVEVQNCGKMEKTIVIHWKAEIVEQPSVSKHSAGKEIYAGRVHLVCLLLSLLQTTAGGHRFIPSVSTADSASLSKSCFHDFHHLIIQFTRSLPERPLDDPWDVSPWDTVIPQLGRQPERIYKTAPPPQQVSPLEFFWGRLDSLRDLG